MISKKYKNKLVVKDHELTHNMEGKYFVGCVGVIGVVVMVILIVLSKYL